MTQSGRNQKQKKRDCDLYLSLSSHSTSVLIPFYRILISLAFQILMDRAFLATASEKGIEVYGNLGFV